MSKPHFEIRLAKLTDPRMQALLRLHLEGMHANSPPGSVFALDLSGLDKPYVSVWSVWQADAIAGIGALKDLGDGTGELKSLRRYSPNSSPSTKPRRR
jgi:putative acetyltransferase